MEGEDYLELPDGRKVNLSHASSGQQEILPLVLTLEAMVLMSSDGVSIYIEEPET